MCDISVVNAVKRNMLSRGSLLGAGAAAGATAFLGSAGSVPARASSHGSKVVDMTHALDEALPTIGGAPGIAYDKPADFADSGHNPYVLIVNEHCVIHIDAPIHCSADRASVDEMPMENPVCPLAVIDISARTAEDADAG